MVLGLARAVVTRAQPVAGLPGEPDLSHAIHSNLVYFVGSHPSDSDLLGKEYVSSEALTTFGSAAFTGSHPTESWNCLNVPGTSSDGAWNTLLSGISGLGNVYTIWADLVFSGVATWSNIICAPWDQGGSWDSPWGTWMFLRNSTSTQARNHFYTGGVVRLVDGPSGSFPTANERKRLWLIRNGTTYQFGVNGAQVGSNVTGSSGPPDFAGSTGNRIVLGNRSPFVTGEGLAGRFLRIMVWSSARSISDMSSLNTDPLLGLYT